MEEAEPVFVSQLDRLPNNIVRNIFSIAVRSDPVTIRALRLCNSVFREVCRSPAVTRFARFKPFSTSLAVKEGSHDRVVERLRRLSLLGNSYAQLAYGVHLFFNEENHLDGSEAIVNAERHEGQKGRYARVMMQIVSGTVDGITDFCKMFDEEANQPDRASIRTSRIFFKRILWYQTYQKLNVVQERLYDETGGIHWDGKFQSISLRNENNVKCCKCGFDLEMFKLGFGFL